MYHLRLILLLLIHHCSLYSFSITNTPVCSVFTTNSILGNTDIFKPHIINGRKRYSTCTGIAWFHGNYVAVLNLYGKKINSYFFNPTENKFYSVQEITNAHGAQLFNPENLTVSPDGTLLAVCSDDPHPGVQFFRISQETHLIQATPVYSLPAQGLVHNVRFSPDGTYVALVGWDPVKSICVYKLTDDGTAINLTLVHSTPNNSTAVKPKGINFTKNKQFAVVCFAPRVTTHQNQPDTVRESLVISYKFNAAQGTLGNIVSQKKVTSSAEDLALLNNDTVVALPDQAGDRVMAFQFNPMTGQLGDSYALLQNPEAQLSFPHGLGISDDGHYLVVTNYGDDKFNLYQIE